MSTAEILHLPLREKLHIMEIIWEDLRGRAEGLNVPQIHRNLLGARRESAAAGNLQILEWDEVKHTIGRA